MNSLSVYGVSAMLCFHSWSSLANNYWFVVGGLFTCSHVYLFVFLILPCTYVLLSNSSKQCVGVWILSILNTIR